MAGPAHTTYGTNRVKVWVSRARCSAPRRRKPRGRSAMLMAQTGQSTGRPSAPDEGHRRARVDLAFGDFGLKALEPDG